MKIIFRENGFILRQAQSVTVCIGRLLCFPSNRLLEACRNHLIRSISPARSMGAVLTVGGLLTATPFAVAAPNMTGEVALNVSLAKAPQAITFAGPVDRAFSAIPIGLYATADSGLAVSFSVVSGPATINGSTLTLSGYGQVVIRAAQAGDASYAAAANVDRTMTIYSFGLNGRDDFNRDGMSDILWTNTVTGELALWFMNVNSIRTNVFVGTVPVEWSVSATGHFDGDAGIFWTNTVTGGRARWRMLGATLLGVDYLGVVPMAWVVSGTGDFDGNGDADCLDEYRHWGESHLDVERPGRLSRRGAARMGHKWHGGF